jgi:hypothetical protein
MKKIIRIKRTLPIKGITSADDLMKLAKRIGVHIDDIITIEQSKYLPKNGSHIILLRGPESDIGHWVCKFNDQYFDSMGQNPPSSIPYIKRDNDIQYQSPYAEYCGNWCLLWLLSKQKNNPDLMDSFYDLQWNEL